MRAPLISISHSPDVLLPLSFHFLTYVSTALQHRLYLRENLAFSPWESLHIANPCKVADEHVHPLQSVASSPPLLSLAPLPLPLLYYF